MTAAKRFQISTVWPIATEEGAMCLNIRPLFNFDPPATQDEIRGASLQFVRKLSGFSKPSKVNAPAFNHAVEEIASAARNLLESLVTTAEPRSREVEALRARARAAARFGPSRNVTVSGPSQLTASHT